MAKEIISMSHKELDRLQIIRESVSRHITQDQAAERIGISLVRDKYPDFGPTFASEKLREIHGLALSAETLRKWMVEEGLWRERRRKIARIYQRRQRRPCYGELIQIDGSPHDWFEARGPRCTLIVFIDDATSGR